MRSNGITELTLVPHGKKSLNPIVVLGKSYQVVVVSRRPTYPHGNINQPSQPHAVAARLASRPDRLTVVACSALAPHMSPSMSRPSSQAMSHRSPGRAKPTRPASAQPRPPLFGYLQCRAARAGGALVIGNNQIGQQFNQQLSNNQ